MVIFCFIWGFYFSAFDKKTARQYWISSLNLIQRPRVLMHCSSLNWGKSCNRGFMPNWSYCWNRRIECNKYPQILEKSKPLSSILHVISKCRKTCCPCISNVLVWIHGCRSMRLEREEHFFFFLLVRYSPYLLVSHSMVGHLWPPAKVRLSVFYLLYKHIVSNSICSYKFTV